MIIIEISPRFRESMQLTATNHRIETLLGVAPDRPALARTNTRRSRPKIREFAYNHENQALSLAAV